MGCYDTMIPKKFTCPVCKAPLKEMQTKDLGEHLDTFEQGKKIEIETSSLEIKNWDGYFIIYELCKICDAWIECKATVQKGKWVKTELYRIEIASKKTFKHWLNRYKK